jgi:hypothetical protein
MSYQIDRFNGTLFVSIDDQTVNTTAADLRLVGRNYSGYGEIQNENFLHLLENFANTTAPPRAIPGQIWFDSGNKKLKFFDGSVFKSAGSSEVSATPPAGLVSGDFWFDTSTQQLKIYNGNDFIVVGPDLAPTFGETDVVPDTVRDSIGSEQGILKIQAGGEIIAIVSNNEFTINSIINPIPGFNLIKKGINLINSSPNGLTSTEHRFWGTATNSDRLGGFGVNDFIRANSSVFTSVVKFSDSGFTVGDQDDFRLRILNGNEPILENTIGRPFIFRISNNNIDEKDVLVVKPTGIEPGNDGIYDLGSAGSKWNDIFADNLRIDNITATGNIDVIGSFSLAAPIGSGTANFTVNLSSSAGQIGLYSGVKGTIDNFDIGSVQAGAGNFTTLSSSGVARITSTAPSTSSSNGALVVSGGVGVSGKINAAQDVILSGTGALKLPEGATAERPAPPLRGMIRFNTNLQELEAYDGTAWKSLGTAIISPTAPPGANGMFWFKSTTFQFYIYYNGQWRLIGPEVLEGFGAIKIEPKLLIGTNAADYAVAAAVVNDIVIAIISSNTFTNSTTTAIPGFVDIVPGINMNSNMVFAGNLNGNSSTASRLATPRRINGVFFDGQSDITLTSSTTQSLLAGSYVIGNNFNGSSQTTWNIDATSNNTAGKIVARDSSGNFSAGTITAALTGNASTASKLLTARTINGVAFDGTANITVADATKVPLTGGTISGSLSVNGTLNVSTSGIKFPNDPGGGSGDTASITYGSIGGERTRLRFNVSNDAAASVRDEAEFLVPDVNGLLVNNNIVLNAANYNNYAPTRTGGGASGTWGINISGNAASATSAASATNATNATNAQFAPTQLSSDNSTRIATTAFVKSAAGRDVAYFQVYDGTFRWGDRVFSGDFEFKVSTGTNWYSPESYFIRLDNPSFLWYWISDPGRISTTQILNKYIKSRFIASDTWLSFRVSISTYPIPERLRIRIYSLIDATPITLTSNTRPLV